MASSCDIPDKEHVDENAGKRPDDQGKQAVPQETHGLEKGNVPAEEVARERRQAASEDEDAVHDREDLCGIRRACGLDEESPRGVGMEMRLS